MRDTDLLRHIYTVAALVGLLAGRGKTVDAGAEERYVRQAKRIGRRMAEPEEEQRKCQP